MNGDWRPASIEGHGFISDGQTGALVYEDCTIDWLCLPRFDSDACFAALLGDAENGGWWLAPCGETIRRTRRYIEDSLVLETVIETADGEVAVIDFMPTERGQAPDIVRIVEGRRGAVEMRSRLAIRFDYGRTHPLVDSRSETEVLAIAGPNAVLLRADVPIEHGERAFEMRFTVRAGERSRMVLTWFPSHLRTPKAADPEDALEHACAYWRRWSARTRYAGVAQEAVQRSLVTLKGLVHSATGGMLAAATASLPEQPRGTRNWDYRFCWLRDSTFTLRAFLHTGHRDEARAWLAWLRRAFAGDPIDVQPFYVVDGARHTIEWEADWLAGFDGAQPVRFGNAAVDQCQIDIYGELIDALWVAHCHGIEGDLATDVGRLAGKLEAIWQRPGAGIWESRGEPKHHVYSKAMCWVAFDRASRMLGQSDPDGARRFGALARTVRAEVLERGFDRERGAFTRAYDDVALDAAVLRLPIVGFIAADDARMISTVAAIERELRRDGLVLRYATSETEDGVGGDEGCFVAVACWFAQVLAMQGRRDDARRQLDRVLEARNDLGLLAEEIWGAGNRALGNFPQALSHVSLINAAMALDDAG